MGSRLLPLALVAGALLADGVGFHRIASYLVLLTVPAAAAAAFVGVADVMEGKDAWARAIAASLALALLLLGAAVRANAPGGAAVPTLAVSALVAALVMYALLPLVGWLIEPLRPRRREPSRVRETRRPAETRTAKAA
jgi:peptidoglycan/LPS O-acetylase OafA/YrhL